MLRTATLLAATALLTACSGGGGSGAAGPSGDAVVSRIDRFTATNERAYSYSPTRPGAVPDSGSARFDGQAVAFFPSPRDIEEEDVSLIGRTRLTANFAQGTVTGTIRNVEGHFGDRPVSDRDAFALPGEVRIGSRDSAIGGDAAAGWSADYRGTLGSGDARIALGGTLDGQFRGTRTSPRGDLSTVRAATATDLSADAVVFGDRRDGQLFIAAEN